MDNGGGTNVIPLHVSKMFQFNPMYPPCHMFQEHAQNEI
jgi:hypothetical protein